jgi:hypothetical protein
VPKTIKPRTTTGGYAAQLKYLIAFLQYVSLRPYSSAEEVCHALKIGESSFYRYLKMSRSFDIDIQVEYSQDQTKKGYKISNYGIFDVNMLERWKLCKN